MGQATKQISDESFESDVLKATGLVLVDFWAEWCGPCRAVGPVLEELATTMAGKAVIAKLNVDNNPATAGKYGVRSIPTLMLFKNGKPVSTKVGALPKQALQAWLEENA